jgi:hypothetical protein
VKLPKKLSASAKVAFADSVLAALGTAPFGTVAKTQLDAALFSALVAAKIVDPGDPVFELARTLQVTPARVNSLVFGYRMQRDAVESDDARLDALATAVRVVSNSDKQIVLNVENRYWRETLMARLKENAVFVDRAFNSERLTLDADQFGAVLTGVFGTRAEDLRWALDRAKKRNAPTAIKGLFVDLGGKFAGGAAGKVGGLTIGALIDAASEIRF